MTTVCTSCSTRLNSSASFATIDRSANIRWRRKVAIPAKHKIAYSHDLVEDIRTFLADLYKYVVENSRSREAFRLLLAEGRRFPKLVDLYFKKYTDPIESQLRARLRHAKRKGQLKGDVSYLAELILSPPLALQVMLLLFPEKLPVNRHKFFLSHIALLTNGML